MGDYTNGLIAHACANEFRKTSGGELGDQSGYELNACAWFDAGWERVYVADDPDKRERMAKFAEEAVTNGFFGYSQNETYRKIFIRRCAEHDFLPMTVNVNRVCDCSTLIYGAILAAFGKEYKFAEDYATPPRTGEFDDYLINSKIFPTDTFTRHNKSDGYAIDPEHLERGHILWMEGHIAIWI